MSKGTFQMLLSDVHNLWNVTNVATWVCLRCMCDFFWMAIVKQNLT